MILFNMTDVYDCGIIGIGVAGAFACYKLAKDHKNVKTIACELGRPPAKRRHQTAGFLGCLPSGDGKLYMKNIDDLEVILTKKQIKNSFNEFKKIVKNVTNFDLVKDKDVKIKISKSIEKAGFEYYLNDYVQMYPKEIHLLSRFLNAQMEDAKNFTFKFDNEVTTIYKQKNIFHIIAEDGEYKCKKLIIAVGRSGWRWINDIYKDFNLVDSNDIARFGIKVEINAAYMKDFNKSNCTIWNKDLEIGPLSWNGTVIPEDHIDMAIAAFRSNEGRWETDKVSFNLIGNRLFEKTGVEQTDRIGRLTFLLANDRVVKEKISLLLNNKSKISIIPEYNWLKQAIESITPIIPDINKSVFHVPCIIPCPPKVNLGTNLETEVEGMHIIGESTSCMGIVSSAITGLSVINEVF